MGNRKLARTLREGFISITRVPESMEGFQLVAGVQQIHIQLCAHTEESHCLASHLQGERGERERRMGRWVTSNMQKWRVFVVVVSCAHISDNGLVVVILGCYQLSKKVLPWEEGMTSQTAFLLDMHTAVSCVSLLPTILLADVPCVLHEYRHQIICILHPAVPIASQPTI